MVGTDTTVTPSAAEAAAAVPRLEESVVCMAAGVVEARTAMVAVMSTLAAVMATVTAEASTPATVAIELRREVVTTGGGGGGDGDGGGGGGNGEGGGGGGGGGSGDGGGGSHDSGEPAAFSAATTAASSARAAFAASPSELPVQSATLSEAPPSLTAPSISPPSKSSSQHVPATRSSSSARLANLQHARRTWLARPLTGGGVGGADSSCITASTFTEGAALISGEIWDRIGEPDGDGENRCGESSPMSCFSLIGEAHERCPLGGVGFSSSISCS
eukprot:scaffold70472_cov60-Phaeocystis_antarctica.AAC.4